MFKITKICAFENKEVILSTMNHDKYNNYACFHQLYKHFIFSWWGYF